MRKSCPATYPTSRGGFKKGDLVKVGPHKARVATARTNFLDGQTRIAPAFSKIRFQWQMTLRQKYLYCIRRRTPIMLWTRPFLLSRQRLTPLVHTAYYTQDITHHSLQQGHNTLLRSDTTSCTIEFPRAAKVGLCFAFPCVDLLETYICWAVQHGRNTQFVRNTYTCQTRAYYAINIYFYLSFNQNENCTYSTVRYTWSTNFPMDQIILN